MYNNKIRISKCVPTNFEFFKVRIRPHTKLICYINKISKIKDSKTPFDSKENWFEGLLTLLAWLGVIDSLVLAVFHHSSSRAGCMRSNSWLLYEEDNGQAGWGIVSQCEYCLLTLPLSSTRWHWIGQGDIITTGDCVTQLPNCLIPPHYSQWSYNWRDSPTSWHHTALRLTWSLTDTLDTRTNFLYL